MRQLYVISIMMLLCAFVAGSAKGVSDTLQFHYTSSVFSELGNDLFWNPSISWKNKYTDFDGGDLSDRYHLSKTVFVTFTDGWHLFQHIEALAWCVCVLLSGFVVTFITEGYRMEKLDNVFNWISDLSTFSFSILFIAVLYVSYTSGFTLFYNILLV